MNKINRIKELVDVLHKASIAYYRDDNPVMSDKQYDDLYDELEYLEKEAGVVYSNSPTQNVGCEVVSDLKKVKHTHAMLSLSKTKSVDELIKVYNNKNSILSLKMDGLTICLTYDNGILTRAETRGDGHVGELVTHNAKVFDNIPLTISVKDHFEIEGEAIITYDDFETINQRFSADKRYKNPRNLAAGSVRQLDSSIAAQRHLKFIAWKVPTEEYSMVAGFNKAKQMGFAVVPYVYLWSDQINQLTNKDLRTIFEQQIQELKDVAETLGYPIDGLVLTCDDIQYGKSLGMTGHHPKHSIAYKFYEDEETTRLRNIEWSMGKTGQLTPVAIFDPIEIDGTTVNRASLHNVSIFKGLNLGIGDEITVYKANAIIPQIRENLTKSDTLELPSVCPICGYPTEIQKDNDSEILICTNPCCKTKLIKRLTHFVSRKCMNIDGLSEETLTKFVEWGWIKNLFDIYNLTPHYTELSKVNGFGIRSVKKLQDAIENSKNVELDHFIAALSIPGIGTAQAKELAKKFKTWDIFDEAGHGNYDFSTLDGFGEVANKNIHNWFYTMYQEDRIPQLVRNLHFIDNNTETNNSLAGMTFVITGSLNHFENRDALKRELESRGAKVSGSVSEKTSCLINNDINSTSSKNKKAIQLKIPIVNEEYIVKMLRQ